MATVGTVRLQIVKMITFYVMCTLPQFLKIKKIMVYKIQTFNPGTIFSTAIRFLFSLRIQINIFLKFLLHSALSILSILFFGPCFLGISLP